MLALDGVPRRETLVSAGRRKAAALGSAAATGDGQRSGRRVCIPVDLYLTSLAHAVFYFKMGRLQI
jgi:hypothetical protein